MTSDSRGSASAGSVRTRLEARIRESWTGRAGRGLLAAAGAYGFAHDLRDFLYETGIARGRCAPIPVFAVGGLTAGGSGKTPVAAAVAGWLADAGWRAALVTAGQGDEMRALELLALRVRVEGGRDRLAAVRRAARAGAEVAVLDSGLQHRALTRALDIVCVDPRSWSLPGRRRLPAGPFRERSGALARADAVVVVARGEVDAAALVEVGGPVRRFAPAAALAVCRLEPTALRAANALAASALPGPRSVAAAGVMWPEDLFRAVRALGVDPGAEIAFPDHEPFGPDRLERLVATAREGGVVCTLKDAVKLGPLLEGRLPVWYVEERPRWERGGEVLRRGVLDLAERATGRSAPAERAGPGE